MGTKVTLRQKPLKGNKLSLYLDFYPPVLDPETGKPTRREFLGKYIYSPIETKTNKKGKEIPIYSYDKEINEKLYSHNNEVLLIAKKIRSERQNVYDKPEIYSEIEKEILRAKQIGERNFVEYFRELTNKKTGTTYDSWNQTLKYLTKFNASLTFANVNRQVCDDFKNFLLTTNGIKRKDSRLSNNTASIRFTSFRSAISQALSSGLLQKNPFPPKSSIKMEETRRDFLSTDELNRLIKADCKSDVLKRSALFSALTGLRHRDIIKMTWSEVKKGDTGYSLEFKQKKTGFLETMPISDQAASLMGERKEPTAKVFDGLIYSAYWNLVLENWVLKAGIKKEITFHCFRHTYATLQLAAGTDIYTVSKMLGHRSIKTTAIYANVLDKAKREASDKIKLDM